MTTPRSKVYFAAIDLGSNSFHMLVVRLVAGGIQVVSKIKRRVHLAAGLTEDGQLEQEAKDRALECLRIFADRVRDIDSTHIRAVGTATMRKIQHDSGFIRQCEQTLGHPIEVISGCEEAATIYQGIAHTTAFDEQMLVIDIGGASTELVLGQGFNAEVLHSLDMGCVSWAKRFFACGLISSSTTDAAIHTVRTVVARVAHEYPCDHQALVLGASGTFKALQEIADHQGRPQPFTLQWLHELLAQCIACGNHTSLHINGLKDARKPVFVSGLCILIGICQSLRLKQLQSTNGALREGVVYGLLARQYAVTDPHNVQQRTLDAVVAMHHLDAAQAQRVYRLSQSFYQQLQHQWSFPDNSAELIHAVAYLHEIGLSVTYKHASAHTTYLVQHLELPGFSEQVRVQVAQLLAATAGIIDDETEVPDTAIFASDESVGMRHLTRIIRLALILAQRRTDNSIPNYQLQIENERLHIEAPAKFWPQNAYLQSLMQIEQSRVTALELLTFGPRV